MSVSIESLFTPVELTLELEWLKARDLLLEENYVNLDVNELLSSLLLPSTHNANG
jgi:hypothetical protein